MKKTVKIFIGILFILTWMSIGETETTHPHTPIEQALLQAKKVSAELAEKMQGLLFRELGKGGFPKAVKVCSEVAQEVTSQFTAQTGHYVRRVSLKYRNPKNIPDDYERRKLEEFERFKRENQLEQEYMEVVKENGKEYFRYLRPLRVVPLCVNCHGPKEDIPSEVKMILREKYPDDRATGFLVGDVRGAISVKIALPQHNP